MSYARSSAEEKAKILALVRKSPVSVQATLAQVGVPRSTYYHWLRRRQACGSPGLKDGRRGPGRPWNRLRPEEVDKVLEYAHQEGDLTSRELAYKMTDEAGFSVSESSVYRILKRHDLIVPAPILAAAAAAEYHRKTKRVHELWQTDLTYLFVVGWGWYYLGGVLDDYSRYLIVLRVVRNMTGPTLTDLVHEAVELTGMQDVPVEHKPALLSDNGSGYISRPFNEYLELQQIRHIFAARRHPQTVGKFERVNRTAKQKLRTVVYRSPEELEQAVAEFQRWYNHQRYHEALGNLRPVDVYLGRREEILSRRREVQRRTLDSRRQHNRARASAAR